MLIPALHEAENLRLLLPELRRCLDELRVRWEILVVTSPSDADTVAVATAGGARAIEQRERGYGGALIAGFAAAAGRYIVTLDADLSHPPAFLAALWAAREDAEVLVASRYVRGGRADMPWSRFLLSRVLNLFFKRGLSLPVRDLSSGFRLYRAQLVRGREFAARDFDILPEILVRIFADGWGIREVPFAYAPRRHGSSNARVFVFGLAYLRTFRSLWALRNSIESADYDARAHDSVIPLQRSWQRSRLRHVAALIAGAGPVLDVGCGSSRIIGVLPPGSVALDIRAGKVRYARRYGRALVQGSGTALPFADGAFPCVLCSQVIEHLPKEAPILAELARVLAPGGRLVLGTPDYSRWEWVWMEALYRRFAPGGYADEHIGRYTRAELLARLGAWGFRLEESRTILRGELILALRKPSGAAPAAGSGRAGA